MTTQGKIDRANEVLRKKVGEDRMLVSSRLRRDNRPFNKNEFIKLARELKQYAQYE